LESIKPHINELESQLFFLFSFRIVWSEFLLAIRTCSRPRKHRSQIISLW